MGLPPGGAARRVSWWVPGRGRTSLGLRLDPKAPTKGLLSVDGCQVVVAEGVYEWETSYSAILLTSLHILHVCLSVCLIVLQIKICSHKLSHLIFNCNPFEGCPSDVIPWEKIYKNYMILEGLLCVSSQIGLYIRDFLPQWEQLRP